MEDWQELAKCRDGDPEVFFPTSYRSADHARYICSECLVRDRCLMIALKRGEPHGIWGDLDPYERREVMRRAKRSGADLSVAAAMAVRSPVA